MTRRELTRIFVLLIAGAGLVSWLIYATRPEAQVHALEAHSPKSTAVAPSISTNQFETEPSTAQSETPLPNETEPTDIVPAGSRTTARHTPLDNVVGPEPLPGLTPAMVLQNMRSA